ncbi:MAG: hypothetical protein H7311_02095 [Ramlibacter sp.]|nr:hypothetical protein [Cryobacterium sp.]
MAGDEVPGDENPKARTPQDKAPHDEAPGEDGMDWLASQLGGGARPGTPDEYTPRRSIPIPRWPKPGHAAEPAPPAPPVDAHPKTAGFLWGLKPTTQTDPRLRSVSAVAPAVPAAAPPAAVPAADPPAGSSPFRPGPPASTDAASAAPLTPDLAPAPLVPAPLTPAPPRAATSAAAADADLTTDRSAVPDSGPVPAAPAPLSPSAPLSPYSGDDSDAHSGAAEPGGTRIIRSQVDLEPAPWWTTLTQSPLVPTAEEAAAADLLAGVTRAPAPFEAPDALPAPVSARSRFRAWSTAAAAAASATVASASSPKAGAAPVAAAPNSAVPNSPAPNSPAPVGSAPAAAAPDEAPTPAGSRGGSGRPPGILKKPLPWIIAGVVLVVVLAAFFFLGQRLGGDPAPVAVPTTSASSTPTPTPTPTPEVTGPQPAGVHQWNTLFGGECLEPYVSPWEEEFTVADCAAPHAAQLVYRGVFAGDDTTVFPGEAELAGQLGLLCSAPGVIDLAAAGDFPDLQVQGRYPITEEQWTGGPRYYYCFVNRSSGDPLPVSVAGPGPNPAG